MKEKNIKPIMIRPTPELRQKIELEAKLQQRSMGNLLLIIITKFFHEAERASR